ncbi:MAG TPA: AAA family ATPase [bacterium]|nr:AAA family ATPase [bacterium]HQL61431.1 AAA family ATPase [bacterium]
MTPDPKAKSGKENPEESGITKITVEGFKSIAERQSIEIRPLTILAGANSSGKSSIMQPLLLLKQTVECGYDPGPLLLEGPNVSYTLPEQFLSKIRTASVAKSLIIGLHFSHDMEFKVIFDKKKESRDLDLLELTQKLGRDEKEHSIRQGMSREELCDMIKDDEGAMGIMAHLFEQASKDSPWSIDRDRCFFRVRVSSGTRITIPLGHVFEPLIADIIHVPGLRGNPERTYKKTATGPRFPGTFENYVASVISDWKARKDKRLDDLSKNLEKLGLTWKVDPAERDATAIEIRVGRLKCADNQEKNDLVSIADVGFGVSQVLPVLVALLVAKPGQLVYLEQPEIHLHPRAQVALAEILADAARRGVRVVAETHSAMLLLAVQSLVAEGKIETDKVILHWFERNEEDGTTKIRSGDLNEAGAYGKWPVDFGKVELELQGRYLNAAEGHLWGKSTK